MQKIDLLKSKLADTDDGNASAQLKELEVYRAKLEARMAVLASLELGIGKGTTAMNEVLDQINTRYGGLGYEYFGGGTGNSLATFVRDKINASTTPSTAYSDFVGVGNYTDTHWTAAQKVYPEKAKENFDSLLLQAVDTATAAAAGDTARTLLTTIGLHLQYAAFISIFHPADFGIIFGPKASDLEKQLTQPVRASADAWLKLNAAAESAFVPNAKAAALAAAESVIALNNNKAMGMEYPRDGTLSLMPDYSPTETDASYILGFDASTQDWKLEHEKINIQTKMSEIKRFILQNETQYRNVIGELKPTVEMLSRAMQTAITALRYRYQAVEKELARRLTAAQ
jgi:hypothetical protein